MSLEELSDRELYFYMGIHLTFVGSTLALTHRVSTDEPS